MNEIELKRDVPLEFDPTLVGSGTGTWVVQNTMPSNDDELYISQVGGTNIRTWFRIPSGDSVRFNAKVWLAQTGRNQWIFPAFETA